MALLGGEALGSSSLSCRSLLSFGSWQNSKTSVAIQQDRAKWSITEREACDLSFWHHSVRLILSFKFQSPLGPILNRWLCTNVGHCLCEKEMEISLRKGVGNKPENHLHPSPGRKNYPTVC